MDKKGLSTIVITLIIILVSLVAIGIIWVVVRNLVGSGSGQIEINAKCISTDIQAVAANCSVAAPKTCTVRFERTGTETSDVGGVKLVFKNVTSGTTYETSSVVDLSGNVDRLLGRTATLSTGLNGVNRVEVSTYFLDSQGSAQICSQTNTLVF